MPRTRRRPREDGDGRPEPPASATPASAASASDAPADPVAFAKSIALRQLAAAPRSRAELARAMARKGVPEDTAEAVLDRFEAVDLLDDAAYAQMLVRSQQASRGLAKRALAHELRAKGIDDELAQQTLDGVGADDELAMARALVAKKLRTTAHLDAVVAQRRLAAMLARKGYPPGMALRVVREALADVSGARDGDIDLAVDEQVDIEQVDVDP